MARRAAPHQYPYAMENSLGRWFRPAGVWYCDKSSSKNMEQKPHKETSEDMVVPEPPATPPEEPAPVMRPEDEALVAERLRELGYIE